MADKKQLKRADHTGIPNDDPFAELTRIMGFDPREPVSRAQPKIIESASLAPNYEDDLSIDLEKELIGELAPLEHEAEAVPARASSAFAVASQHIGSAAQSDDSLAEDFDLVFDAELAEPAVDAATEMALSDELDAAFVSRSDLDVPIAEERGAAPAAGVVAGRQEVPFAIDRDHTPELIARQAAEKPYHEAGGIHVGFADEAASAEADDSSEYMNETDTDELGEQLVAAFEQHVAEYENAATAEFEASTDDAERETAKAYYDAPLIPLGGARDFAHADDSEAEVDMDFEAEFAIEPEEAEAEAHATASDDDLEAELSVLLGKGAPVAAPHAGTAWTDASSSDEIAIEITASELSAVETLEPDDSEGDLPVEAVSEAYGHDDDELAAYPEARSWEEDQPSMLAEEELRAKLAAFDREFGREMASEYGSHVNGEATEDVQTVQPTYADEPVVNDPGDEQPVTPGGFAHSSTPGAPEEEDPFAALAAMVRGSDMTDASGVTAAPASMNEQDGAWSADPTPSESPTVRTTGYHYQNHSHAHRAPVSVPDIETVEVPEAAVALADDLDIPEVAFDDDLPAADFDDFEAELASAFGQHTDGVPTPAANEPARASVHGETYHHEFAQPAQQDPAGGAMAAAAATLAAMRTGASDRRAADRHHEFDGGGPAGGHLPGAYQAVDDEDLDFDPALGEEIAIPSYREAGHRPSGRRGVVIAAVVGGLAVIGGLGAFALSAGSGGSGKPDLVRADTDPVKVRPENPGGTTVPNQDNKVFQTMNGTDKGAAPTQEKLISGSEEPVDMAARAAPPAADDEAAITDDPIADEIAAAPKGEERVASADADEAGLNDQGVAVAPRRVRTMVVRADGTLVPSEEPVLSGTEPTSAAQTPAGPDAAALEPADPAKDLTDPAVGSESTASLTPAAVAPAEPETASAPAEPETAAAPAEAATPAPTTPEPAAQAGQSEMPATGPAVPSRPADQPLDVVGEVNPQQVAAATPADAAPPAGAWSVQIASQPSQAAAKSTYEDLSRRFESVIGGRGVNIVKADIAGKGTFWRVRVPAGSRAEAVSLCESYKSAGGNCFVSK
jgi:SPOR domain